MLKSHIRVPMSYEDNYKASAMVGLTIEITRKLLDEIVMEHHSKKSKVVSRLQKAMDRLNEARSLLDDDICALYSEDVHEPWVYYGIEGSISEVDDDVDAVIEKLANKIHEGAKKDGTHA